ncbi:hypothetical protein A2U01_0023151, partial [Trifolium medium]|nr:hypothetical protein [Trifolium medium]
MYGGCCCGGGKDETVKREVEGGERGQRERRQIGGGRYLGLQFLVLYAETHVL